MCDHRRAGEVRIEIRECQRSANSLFEGGDGEEGVGVDPWVWGHFDDVGAVV